MLQNNKVPSREEENIILCTEGTVYKKGSPKYIANK